ncbi:MAG: DUF177 domain-containing protein [Saprospiraceae bacterium]|nr:DUF177 domain-containing protein [Saprospiraceae bacterium]MBK9729317.1 DUF177 domain-containing protein [Saprospiraceae bacterium]
MDSLKEYTIPLRSLYPGLHVYKWTLDANFFKNFELSLVHEGQFNVDMQLDKQEELSIILIQIQGKYPSICDRCLAEIEIPIDQSHQLYIKNGIENSEDPDLIYLPMETNELKMADILYDYVCLSLPLSQVIDCENLKDPPCNMDVLGRIQNEEGLQSDTSVWDALKNINKN